MEFEVFKKHFSFGGDNVDIVISVFALRLNFLLMLGIEPELCTC
jgi:hypothetical protein